MESPMKPAWLFTTVVLGLLTAWTAAQEADPVLASFEVARDGDALVLPVRLDSKTYSFLVDTGTTFNCFDRCLLAAKPLKKTELEAPDGPITLELFPPPQATIGALKLQSDQSVVGMDFEKLRQGTGIDLYGVIGMDFLRRHVIRIDFDRGKLEFLTGVGADPGEAMSFATSAEDMLPRIWATIPGWLREPFLIDSGHLTDTTGSLKQSLFRSLLTDGKLAVVQETLGATVRGTAKVRMGRGRGLTVQGFEVSEPLYCEEVSENRLGLAFLARFVVTFDFPQGVMYLKKGKRFDEPDRLNLTGLHGTRKNGYFVIDEIEKDSPAAKSGLRTNDVLLRVGDTSATDVSVILLRRRLCTAEKQLRVTVQRGEQRIEATLLLDPKS
jgi:hypothetical protein